MSSAVAARSVTFMTCIATARSIAWLPDRRGLPKGEVATCCQISGTVGDPSAVLRAGPAPNKEELTVSPSMRAELRDVLQRPHIAGKYRLSNRLGFTLLQRPEGAVCQRYPVLAFALKAVPPSEAQSQTARQPPDSLLRSPAP